MVACSHDGSVAVVRFGRGDLGGAALSADEMAGIVLARQGAASFALPIAENPDALRFRATGAATPTPALDETTPKKRFRLDTLMSRPPPTTLPSPAPTPPARSSIIALQQESRSADGKRRIVPVLADAFADAAPLPATQAPTQVTPTPLSSSFTLVTPTRALTPPEMRSRFVVTVDETLDQAAFAALGISRESATPIVIEVVAHNTGKSLLSCSRGSSSLWRTTLPGRVVAVAANAFSSVAVTEIGDMFWLSAHGARLHPPIVLSAQPYLVALSKSCHVLTLCVDGVVHVYNLRERRCTLACNVSSLLTRGAELVEATLDERQRPRVTLANGDVHVYADALQAWIRVVDSSFVQSELFSVFGLKDALPNPPATLSRLSLEERSFITLAHAEHEMTTADLLGDTASYRRWAAMLFRQLVMYARETHPVYRSRLEELCLALLGPTGAGHVHDWETHAAGGSVSKRELLAEMLPIMATNVTLQKLTSELHDALQQQQPVTLP